MYLGAYVESEDSFQGSVLSFHYVGPGGPNLDPKAWDPSVFSLSPG